ncbi:MAG TPA: PIN domain-containing protein [Verrucomicrobiae bacterium]|jgi:predicted nucleic acid-binding protein|nr:PIN domain-containing protein [Verrucomicrobiae bacterium]
MKLFFADAGFWIGLRNRTDINHRRALRIAEKVMHQRVSLLLTPLVFAEVHAHFARSLPIREQVIRDCWENPIVKVEQATPSDQTQAMQILRAHKDKTFSFCDAVSFAVMLRLEITTALSFDEHFRQFGRFDVLGGNSR